MLRSLPSQKGQRQGAQQGGCPKIGATTGVKDGVRMQRQGAIIKLDPCPGPRQGAAFQTRSAQCEHGVHHREWSPF